MRKFVSIIIPRYKEKEMDLFPLLSSISTQVGIDFGDVEVIICNDAGGEPPLDEEFKGLFGFDIREINAEENKGPGVARQIGLDAAKGDYVMFCDADDRLHNVGVLGGLIHEAEENVPDVIRTSWMEEVADEDGNYRYITHDVDNTWMFGKMFRRRYLISSGIRFHDDLRVHEDSYFNQLATSLTDRVRFLPILTYIWKFNPGSITRRENGVYTYDSMPEYIRAMTLAYAEIEKKMPGRISKNVVELVCYIYFSLHQPHWLEKEHEKYLIDSEDAFARYLPPVWHYFKEADPQVLGEAYNNARANNFQNCVEQETIGEWLERLGMESR